RALTPTLAVRVRPDLLGGTPRDGAHARRCAGAAHPCPAARRACFDRGGAARRRAAGPRAGTRSGVDRRAGHRVLRAGPGLRSSRIAACLVERTQGTAVRRAALPPLLRPNGARRSPRRTRITDCVSLILCLSLPKPEAEAKAQAHAEEICESV